ncbi:hypothetical protein Goshw_025177, partial [Gossypium schwendimanii]|nr:hypothetical protein [Gossypium schwendimanii]
EVGVISSWTNINQEWKLWLVLEIENQSIQTRTKPDLSYWAIWYNRNRIYHKGIRDKIRDMVVFINAYSLEIQQVGESTKLTPTQVCDKWEPPDDNIVKVNF